MIITSSKCRPRNSAVRFWLTLHATRSAYGCFATDPYACDSLARERIRELFRAHEVLVRQRAQEGYDGRLLCCRQMQADPSCHCRAAVVRLHDQGTQRAAVSDAAVVVIQHLLERLETAIVHIGRGEHNVPQRR